MKYSDFKKSISLLKEKKLTAKAVDLSNLSIREADLVNQYSLDTAPFSFGAGCKRLVEPVPNFIEAECEKVYKGDNNTFIVLGRDRPGSRFTGYGGKGHSACGAIDIVVGRNGRDATGFLKDGNEVGQEPDFKKDAARIYISQKTDIDKNFQLRTMQGEVAKVKGSKITRFSDARSGIGLKADCVRIIGRQDVKIVTGTDKRNSQSGGIRTPGTISLIAGNYSGVEKHLQGVTKANSTAEAFRAVLELIDGLRTTLNGAIEIQKKFNKAMASHVHHTPFYGLPTAISVTAASEGKQAVKNHFSRTITSLDKLGANIELVNQNYFEMNSPQWIGSRRVKTT